MFSSPFFFSLPDFKNGRKKDDDAVITSVALGFKDFGPTPLSTPPFELPVSDSLDDPSGGLL